MGFEPSATIRQTMKKPVGKETFVMNKIYLVQNWTENARFIDQNN